MDKIKLRPTVFFTILPVAALIITGSIYIGTKSSLSGLIHIPSFNRPLTPQQLAAQAAAKAKKVTACVNNVKGTWGSTISLAASENLPVASYQAQEQKLINQCQS